MPESCGGRDGDEERRDRGNIVSAISQFADDNLTLVRVGSALSPSLQLLGGSQLSPSMRACRPGGSLSNLST